MGGRMDPEKKRQYMRAWHAAHREENRQRARERYEAKREEHLAYMREYQRTHQSAKKALIDDLWQEQGGCCYLCEEPVERESAVLEHDHRCCPRGQYCRTCIRGVACYPCNNAIGNAKDDPERLERLARNLRAMQEVVGDRLSDRPFQDHLFDFAGEV